MRGQHNSILFTVAVLLVATAWWFINSDASNTAVTKVRATTSGDGEKKPHFKSRSATYVPLATETQTTKPDQDTVELVYPDGILLACPALDLDDGEYRVNGSAWRQG